MTDKTGYKYSIKANQSLSSGMIGLEGYFAFDTFDEFMTNKDLLVKMMKAQEAEFKTEGFKCCSIIPNNMKDLASKKTQEKISGAKAEGAGK